MNDLPFVNAFKLPPLAFAALLSLASPSLAADEPPMRQRRGRHGTEGGEILLPAICRRLRHRHPAGRNHCPPGAAGPEGRGDPGRCRRYRHRRADACPAHPARRRHDGGCRAGRRPDLEFHGRDRRRRLGPRRGAVFHHRAQRIRPGRAWCRRRISAKLAVNQTARISIIGAGEVEGKVRRVAATVEPNSQLGQVFVGITTNRRLLVNSVRPRHDQDRAELRRRRCR